MNSPMPVFAPDLPEVRLHYLLACLLVFGLAGCKSGTVNEAAACPQSRLTELAPASIASRHNPLAVNENSLRDGKHLYEEAVSPVACIECHGENGEGNGRMSSMFEPAPRNFTCAQMMDSIPDGQLYWVIKNGSIGTSMPTFDKLSDDQIWKLVIYIRGFSTPSISSGS